MNNQEICRFVNSKDIRKYLADINYSFTTAEAAWLVYQCRNATLAEKYAAWEKIIATMPDQSVDSFHFDKPYESIHKVISDFIAMKKEVTWNYMDFKYFPEEQLTGKKRILKALSNLLKEKIDIELFTKAYHLIRAVWHILSYRSVAGI